jgi:NAD(P)-dependent dehydrogenase (short-subunit alcohol dehydrogenase family)
MSSPLTQSVLITGSNTGIGLPTAANLLKDGYKVYITTRDDKKTIETLKALGNHPNAIAAPSMDLNNLLSVQQFTDKFNKNQSISIIICNAGIMALPKLSTNSVGVESQVGVNHLAHFLLVRNLLPTLHKTAMETKIKSRIVMVSSLAHRYVIKEEFTLQDAFFPSEDNYNPTFSYGYSKLFNIWMAGELNRRYEWLDAFSLHPGVVNSELTRHLPGYDKGVRITNTPFGTPLSSEEGCQTTLTCVKLPRPPLHEKKNPPWVHYYDNSKEVERVSERVRSVDEAKALWEFSEQVVQKNKLVGGGKL